MTCPSSAWPSIWSLGIDDEGAPLTLARRRDADGVAVYAIFRGTDENDPGGAELYGLTDAMLIEISQVLHAERLTSPPRSMSGSG